ncbi:MAG: tRNA epoxyqueuosine(34) reductase QueG [Hyphomonadaceae bacterium]|nr:MAG: iron-sulfur cluster binding protein [Caulobacteraceae bacterium]MBT9444268.1 tRNA epoxyqueuosine(34) reductase QueG [Hyphomonadaceae bacterium]TPW08263.1 MAG: iron-sulfur cluster binding protein [Alphaproteobacteria bacterium]
MTLGKLRTGLETRATSLGFSAFGVASATTPWPNGAHLEQFLVFGRHGDMAWMASEAHRRMHPTALWPDAKSAVMVGVSYAPDADPLALLQDRTHAALAGYAVRRDYHEVIKGRLKQLAQWLAAETAAEVKVFVDTAPLMEKPLAQRAGLGWQGKHTNLVSRTHGSWLLLGAILTAAEIAPDAAEEDHCGSCRACLDICPTDAFPAPYQLDARRCIAYLTIEHAGPIPHEYREAIGNRVFGCDDCLAVCPWNKFADAARDQKMAAREDLQGPALADLAALDDAAFRARFAGTPIKRTGRDRVVRNTLIAIGNSGEAALAAHAEALLGDESPVVRGAAVWALRRLLDPARLSMLKETHAAGEADPDVRGEWA